MSLILLAPLLALTVQYHIAGDAGRTRAIDLRVQLLRET